MFIDGALRTLAWATLGDAAHRLEVGSATHAAQQHLELTYPATSNACTALVVEHGREAEVGSAS